MEDTVRISIKKEIWDWALVESQKDESEFLSKFSQAEKWFEQELDPTFKQIEKVAAYFQIPFGYMFLDTPPKKNVMDVEFRSIKNKVPRISKDLQDTIIEMDRRRSWMRDYRKDLGWDKLEVIQEFSKLKEKDISKKVALAKNLLDLPEEWYTQVKDHGHAFRFLRNRLEDIGILVMQSGIVGANTRRLLNIDEFRAFVLYDEIAPLIFINNKDSRPGKVFSLIHEYFHVLFEQEDVLLDPYSKGTMLERKINALTAEFLMPNAKLINMWKPKVDAFNQIEKLSYVFKVSRLALAIKLYDLDLVRQWVVEKVQTDSILDFEKKPRAKNSPIYYPTYYSRISMPFLKAVIRSAESGGIGYNDAFKLLGVAKGKTYNRIKSDVMPYG